MSFYDVFFSNEITWETASLRLALSFLVSLIIGVERQAHSQPAGLRTHILISIGSTIVMLLSIYIPQTFTTFQNGDPARLAAQVVSGIGFLGAGAILRFGGNVRGLTTAASIWAMAAIGLAIGAGMYIISAIGAGVVLFALTVMDVFEKKVFREKVFKRIEVTMRKKNSDINLLSDLLKGMRIRISSVDFSKNTGESTDRIIFIVQLPETMDMQLFSDTLEKTEGIVAFSVEMIS